jgi:YspA, cpYpsA-related SLOG family
VVSERVIVCGSRHWHDREAIANRLFGLPPDSTIVHGNAAGADRIAHQEAQKLGLLTEPHSADWERYGKSAGPIRNHEMAELGADLCLAFWDGSSAGTKNMLEQAKKHGIPVEIITA